MILRENDCARFLRDLGIMLIESLLAFDADK